jgi:hypothetical protein
MTFTSVEIRLFNIKLTYNGLPAEVHPEDSVRLVARFDRKRLGQDTFPS